MVVYCSSLTNLNGKIVFQGFYRGFGALILQYMMHAILLRAAKYLFERLSQEFGSTPTRHPRPASLPSPPSPGLYTRLPSSVYEKDGKCLPELSLIALLHRLHF